MAPVEQNPSDAHASDIHWKLFNNVLPVALLTEGRDAKRSPLTLLIEKLGPN